MKSRLGVTIVSALAITFASAALGLAVNEISSEGLPLGAERATDVSVASLGAARAAHLGDDATFIDARTAAAYRDGHVAGALNVPYADRREQRDALIRSVPRARPLIVYCSGANCQLAPELAEWLSEQGWRDVRVLVDGFPGWREAGYPIGTGERP